MEGNELIVFTYSVIIILLLLCLSILYFWILNRNKQRSYQYEKEVLENKYNSALLESKLEVSEQTMKEISQEIHDNVGQRLTLCIQLLNNPESSKAEQSALLTEALADLRDISKSLNSSYISDMGLDLAMERECGLIEKASQIKCTYSASDDLVNLSSDVELILFRCFQEILNNCIKHSSANTIEVLFQSGLNETILQVSDDGVGFDVQNGVKGVGLHSIEERINLIKGSLHIDSAVGIGTTIKITIPKGHE